MDSDVTGMNPSQAMEVFHRTARGEGGMVLKRRELLTRILVGTGAALAAPIIETASAVASPIETEDDFDTGLAEVTRRLYKIGADHMKFHTDPSILMGEAAAAWRDALIYKRIAPSRAMRRVTDAESFAAGLVAQFHGDRGDVMAAQAWYSKAWYSALESHVKSWLIGCQVWIPLYAGNGQVAVTVANRARDFQTFREPERIVFTQLQAARAFALNGDVTKARRAFWEAENQWEKKDCDTHRESEPNLLHFTQWQFYIYAAEIMGAVGKFHYAREYRKEALKSPHLNGMNKAVLELVECNLRLAEGDAAGAADHAIETVQSLKKADATSAVVRGRVDSLAKQLRQDYGAIPPVTSLEEFAETLGAAA